MPACCNSSHYFFIEPIVFLGEKKLLVNSPIDACRLNMSLLRTQFWGFKGAPTTQLVIFATIGLHFLVPEDAAASEPLRPFADALRFDNVGEVILAVMLLHGARNGERASGPRRFAALFSAALLVSLAASLAMSRSNPRTQRKLAPWHDRSVGPFGLVFSLLVPHVALVPERTWWQPILLVLLACSQGVPSGGEAACGVVLGAIMFASGVCVPSSMWALHRACLPAKQLPPHAAAAAAAAAGQTAAAGHADGGGAAVQAAVRESAEAAEAAAGAAAAAPPLPREPSAAAAREAGIAQLCGMGFDPIAAARALEVANDQIDVAVNMLVSGTM